MGYKSPIAQTYGEVYLGVVFAGVLYGITVVQTYIYLVRYPDDRMGIKSFVLGIFILDTVHQSSITYAVWHYLIDSFDVPLNLLAIHWSFDIYFVLSLIIGFAVQPFYTYRIWVLTQNRLICCTIALLTSLYIIFGFYFAAQVIRNPIWAALPKYTYLTDISLASSVAADLLIAITMTVALRMRSTDYDSTRGIIQKMIVYAVGTGILTMVMSLLTLIFFATSTNSNFMATLLYFMLAKFYTNAALISLNARQHLRAKMRTPLSSSNSVPRPIRFAHVRHQLSPDVDIEYPPVIHIHKTIETDVLRGSFAVDRERC